MGPNYRKYQWFLSECSKEFNQRNKLKVVATNIGGGYKSIDIVQTLCRMI